MESEIDHVTKEKKVAVKSSQKSMAVPHPLKKAEVYAACPASYFSFQSTKQVKAIDEIISQDRAVDAIAMGLGIRKPGYNIYVAGIQGTGKTSVIKSFLENSSKKMPSPFDVVYVYNFKAPEAPYTILLKPGKGRILAKDMDQALKELTTEIPRSLQSEAYENSVNAFVLQSNEQQSAMFSELETVAKSQNFQLKTGRMGIETVPVIDGRPLTEKEYNKLSAVDRKQIEDSRASLDPLMMDFARRVRSIEIETREHIKKLQNEIVTAILEKVFSELKAKYKSYKEILVYFKDVKEDIIENLEDFLESEDDEPQEHHPHRVLDQKDDLQKYRINVFVDNSELKSAPVVIETNPTYYNLFGKIEKNLEHGMYHTDFMMIRAGSIHRANGGFLVLDANDIFKNPSVWETLKRVLRTRQGFIEDMGEQYSLLPTSGLRPKPIDLDIKVILIGNDDIYQMLYHLDDEFSKLFKIKSDFDFKMPRNKKNISAYMSFVATRVKKESLLHFDKSGVCAIVEYGSRLVDDQESLSTQFGEIKDLTIEADFVARQMGSKLIRRVHVEEAIHRKIYRVNLSEDHLLEMVKNRNILLTLDGTAVGQVNGLAVYDQGDHSFGKVSRISCTTSVNSTGIINIERSAKLSGNIHDKGIMILSGFLNAILARQYAFGLSASICFEQSYGLIDGDSASIAELTAILSSFADLPVMQNLAMTGSLNQFGEVQPIGGVNQKIEGFFKTCKTLGKSKFYTVIIPAQNTPHLMLNQECQAGVESGVLRIIPVNYFWEVFYIATGQHLGVKRATDKEIEPGSALAIVLQKLKNLRLLQKKQQSHKE